MSAHQRNSSGGMQDKFTERILTSVSSVNYVGNESTTEDLDCAAEHGTTRIKLAATDNNGAMLAEVYTNQKCEQLEMSTMTLLIPDRDRDNQEDFVWCIPIERQKWNKWYALSEKFKTAVPKEHGGCRYMNRMEGREVKTVLVMPNESQTDDDAVTACAFLRLVKGFTCRMYIVRCTDDPLTGAALIARVAGGNVNIIAEVEFTDEGCTTNK